MTAIPGYYGFKQAIYRRVEQLLTQAHHENRTVPFTGLSRTLSYEYGIGRSMARRILNDLGYTVDKYDDVRPQDSMNEIGDTHE